MPEVAVADYVRTSLQYQSTVPFAKLPLFLILNYQNSMLSEDTHTLCTYKVTIM